ncbi:MAG: hypothetical protein ACLPJH_11185 [Myxococcaceae bacterium]
MTLKPENEKKRLRCQLGEDDVSRMLLHAAAQVGGARVWMLLGIAGMGCGRPGCAHRMALFPVAHCLSPRETRADAEALAAQRRALTVPPPHPCPTCGSPRHTAQAVELVYNGDAAEASAAVARVFVNELAQAFGE